MANNQGSDRVPQIGLITAVHRDLAFAANDLLERGCPLFRYDASSFRLLISDPINKANVEAIKTATFVVCIDQPTPTRTSAEEDLEGHLASKAVHMLHGHGVDCNTANRWFNKTMQVYSAVVCPRYATCIT